MRIGDSVTYKGRNYVVVGFTPMSVRPPEIQLQDPQTGALSWVPWPPAEPAERAALRLARAEDAEPDEKRQGGGGGI